MAQKSEPVFFCFLPPQIPIQDCDLTGPPVRRALTPLRESQSATLKAIASSQATS